MDAIDAVLNVVTDVLKNVPGIEAVVLGGSRARGTHSPDSDIDIGIYYDARLDLSVLEVAARQLDDEHRENLIAAPGQWGKWVNGGGWLVLGGFQTDFILRDVERVKTAIEECQEGNVTAHYQTGHPHAFLNTMYMGELAVSKMLWDGVGEVSELKIAAETYPPKMKTSIIEKFIFEAGFSCMLAERNASKDDGYYVTAHLVRAVSALNQVVFALNEEYCLNEKKAVRMIETFSIRPEGYKEKVDAIFALAGTDSPAACERLKCLLDEVANLLHSDYSSMVDRSTL